MYSSLLNARKFAFPSVEDEGTFDEIVRRTVGTRYSLVSNAYAITCRRVYFYTNVERARVLFSTEILECGASVHFKARGCIFRRVHRTPRTWALSQ